MSELPLNTVLCGDCREIMATFPEDSIDLVVTSPPYWGLRDYGHEDQIGLEDHPQKYVDSLLSVSREINRIIKPSGSFWLNLGDSYYGSMGNNSKYPQSKNQRIANGMPNKSIANNYRDNWLQPKQLLGIPWRVAIALQHDGWILRNCVIWYKPNHMPESVKDRLTKSYEFFFFFVKQQKYYFDLDSIRVPHQLADRRGYNRINYNGKGNPETRQFSEGANFLGQYPEGKNPGDVLTKHEVATGRIGNFSYSDPLHKMAYHENGKNPGDFWEINTQPFPGSHFAVFPPELITPIIKSCSPLNGTILDPFAGSGTALRVARKLGRKFIGIELNPEYAEMCERRVRADSYTPPPEGVPTLTEMFESDHE